MTLSLVRLAFVAAALSGSAAAAQEAADPHAGHDMAATAATLPAACMEAAPKSEAMAAGGAMKGSAKGDAGPVEAGNRAAMMAMHGPMTAAAGIADADLAFNCGMIAHHIGAIAMSKVELEHGKDATSRALAETIIAAQEKEIADMTAWVKVYRK